MTYLEEYWNLITSGEVVVGYWVRKQIENLISDLSNPDYVYNTAEADKRIAFEQKLCLQKEEPYYLKPLVLMPWQKAFWEALYSFKMADTGKRRFTEALLEIARKNGKSSMLAADGNFDLFVGKQTDLCCASNDDKQCRIIWHAIADMRTKLDPKKVLTSQNLTELRNKETGTSIFRLSSKTQNKDGFNISKTYLDESHDIDEENGQSEVAEACWRGMSTREEPLFINSTTQGFNRECYLDKKLEYAKKVISGEIDDINFLAFLYEQDSEAEIWQDESSWEKSNPAIRYGVKKIAKLRRDVESAKYDKATRIHLLTKDFNLPQSTAQGWILLEDYDYPQEQITLDSFRDSFYIGAVDLSATTDLTCAKALLMKEGDPHKYIFGQYFIPESKLHETDDSEVGASYVDWARDGLVTVHEGNEVDISAVADWFYSLFDQYGLRPFKIGYDQRYAKTFLDRCQYYGFDTEMLGQGRALSNAMKLLEADFKSKNINYGNNPVDKWNFGNCCVVVDNYGNIKPVKAKGQPKRRIDGTVTTIMAVETYRRHRSDYLQIIGG